MSLKLVIVRGYDRRKDDRDWYIGWESEDGQGVDLYLGEAALRGRTEPEVVPAECCMMGIGEANRLVWSRRKNLRLGAWCTSNKEAAVRALIACKVAISAMSHARPLKAWEQKALDAGWKPPKGRL